MLDKIEELGVELVIVDNTNVEQRIIKDLARAGRSIIPVNLIYPPNYPEEPAVLLEELIGPAEALKALSRMEEIVNGGADNSNEVAKRAP